MADALLERIEDYYDAVPRSAADTEEIGAFTLFVSRGGWPYYARPGRGYRGPPADVENVAAVRHRQRELGAPETFEWVDEVTTGLIAPVERAGLQVTRHPLQVLGSPLHARPPDGVTVRLVPPDDPELGRINAAVHLGFASAGTLIGDVGGEARDTAAADRDERGLDRLRARLAEGLTVMVVAEDARGPLAAGSHQPLGDVTELVGIATLPAARRRGLGAAVTSRLVADAHDRGVGTVFLSAGSDDIARVYEKVGFRRVATACIAEDG
jgi:N-acetylglutamate synthase-like GNAT family acetyltransferase